MPIPCLPPDTNACASKKKKKGKKHLYVSIIFFLWLQIMHLNRDLFEKCGSKRVPGLGQMLGSIWSTLSKLRNFLAVFCYQYIFTNTIFSGNGTHVLIVKVAFFQYSLKLITLGGSRALYLICEQLFIPLHQYKAMFHIASLPDYYTIVF